MLNPTIGMDWDDEADHCDDTSQFLRPYIH